MAEPKKEAFNRDDPMVAFMLTRKTETVVLTNDDEGRNDPIQRAIFSDWINYLRKTGQNKRARCWLFFRQGGSKCITLPCADPYDFEAFRKTFRPGSLRNAA